MNLRLRPLLGPADGPAVDRLPLALSGNPRLAQRGALNRKEMGVGEL